MNEAELREEYRILKRQVGDLMEFMIWLKGFERDALHWSVWIRMDDVWRKLAQEAP